MLQQVKWLAEAESTKSKEVLETEEINTCFMYLLHFQCHYGVINTILPIHRGPTKKVLFLLGSLSQGAVSILCEQSEQCWHLTRPTELLCSSPQSSHLTGQLTSITLDLTWIQEKTPTHNPILLYNRPFYSTIYTSQKDTSKLTWQYHLMAAAEQGELCPSFFLEQFQGLGL